MIMRPLNSRVLMKPRLTVLVETLIHFEGLLGVLHTLRAKIAHSDERIGTELVRLESRLFAAIASVHDAIVDEMNGTERA